MEIHELNTKALTDPAYVPFDDGTDTYKAEFNEVVENAANAAVAAADLTNNSVAFTSGDAASPTAWSSVSVITSGSTLATLFNRISTMVKNVRWLYSKLGTTDISSIGGGTVTGAISALNGNIGLNNASLKLSSSDWKALTPTAGSNYSAWGGCRYVKKGHIVQLVIAISGITANTYYAGIVTLPQGYRPSYEIVTYGNNGNITGTCCMTVNSSGVANIYSNGTYALATITYFACN